MNENPRTSPYSTYVESKQFYIHPKTGMVASKLQIKKLKIKPTTFLYLKRKDDHSVIERVKVQQYESIIPLKNVSERSVEQTLARFRAYHSIWQNKAGQIRISINGIAKGKRIKEVIHLPFFRRHWEMRYAGYEKFKKSLVGIVLTNLRRRGLRLSNPKESRERIARLLRNKKGLEQSLYITRDPVQYQKTKRDIENVNKSIRDQKQSRQMTKASIRIEKIGLLEEP